MIGFLRGTLLTHADNRGIIDVRDVGYEVFAPKRTLAVWANAEGPVEVYVSTQVREDAFLLYGFSTDNDRIAFNTLIGVSGIGPKLGLACLDTFDVDALASTIEQGDIKALTRISGVGKRTAERMALELKGKLPTHFAIAPSSKPLTKPAHDDPFPLAMARLGYTKSEIASVTSKLAAQGITAENPIAERLRAALQVLSGR